MSATETTNARTQAALDLAAQGLPVFPCNAKKEPLVRRGFYAATRDTDVIRAWFERWPDALIGVPTGAASGIDVVDTDPRNGCASWFEDNSHRMPVTRIHITRGGGKHILFRHAPDLGCSGDTRIHAGVDVKADGGYIIWHPASGCEVWLEWALDDLAHWPDWLLPLARAGQPADRNAKDGSVSLADRLPPSGDAVVALLDRMPNPLDADRGVYTAVMPAAQGCIDALAEAGTLGDDDESRIGDAAVAWAERWEGRSRDNETDERAKWEDDWSTRHGPLAGWQTLEKVACALLPGYGLERAQAEFSAVPPPTDGPADEPLILDRGAPLASAQALVRREYTAGPLRTLHHQADTFFTWTGARYRERSREESRAAVYHFLDRAGHAGKERMERFNPTRNRVADVLEALGAVTQLPDHVRAPAWLTDAADMPTAADILPCENGLLHLPTRRLLPHTPGFFGINALPYAFDRHAPGPAEWLRFLGTVWPDDQESIATLQELFGLLLTGDTRHQKIFLLVGPKRSGKGTIGRVLTALLGRENVCNPTLAGLATNFGLEPLIGKPLAVISDARLGGRTDAHAVAERLLSISGEDGQTIDRKFRSAWEGTLPTRFVILSNELPRLTDASGALASRFIALKMVQSFFGREDQGLTARLLRELPSILAWSLAGLDRLKDRGHFLQPMSARKAIADLEDLASPIGAFLKERCIVGPGRTADCDDLFGAWVAWCHQQRRDAVGTKQTFGRDLHAAIPMLDTRQVRVPGSKDRTREFCGVGVLEENTDSLATLV